MFDEIVRHCKTCKYWQTKDWGLPWERKCELGEKTPDGGFTRACSSHKKQLSLFEIEYHCENCARWDNRLFHESCIKGYPTPKGGKSQPCEKFVKG
jgi:hypothetical protein